MITIERFAYAPSYTLGVLRVGEFECFTIERPWLDNRAGLSCIPEGTYAGRLRRYYAGKYDVPGFVEVPGRSDILIHKANRASELRGCVAPGMSVGVLGGETAVLQSETAFLEIMRRLRSAAVGKREFPIVVSFVNRYGPKEK